MALYAIHAKKFLLPNRVAGEGYLTVVNGKFGTWTAERPDCDIVEASGSWVAPGFVDTHIHGFLNHDVMDCDPKGINEARAELARKGTTSWLATTLTASIEETGHACEAVVEALQTEGEDFVGCRTQGIFLEGPFFTEKHKGAQNPAYMLDPNYDVFCDWQDQADGLIKKSAIAPEREGSCEYASKLAKEGVVTALGHSNATYEQGVKVLNAGASVFVHVFNGMSGLHHREPGLVGCAMTTENSYAELICDGLHINPVALKAFISAKGWDHVVLVSDCLRCGGMPEGDYTLGEFPIVMKDGVCRLKDSENIAGSVITVQKAAQNVFNWGIVTAEQALRMGAEVPAKSAHIDDVCGSIKEGRDADFVVLDDELNLCDVYMSGELVK